MSKEPTATVSENSNLRKEIESSINRHSAENGSNTPDFILAQYLVDCIAAFDKAVQHREAWYGRAFSNGDAPPPPRGNAVLHAVRDVAAG
jgi:hypothetical protein